MSRSGYSDGIEYWALIRWRGAVASAIRGKRGQAFLREMRDALDAMPEKVLIANDLVDVEGSHCALGVVGAARGVDLSSIDVGDYEQVASAFGIAQALAQEIEYENDECISEWGAYRPNNMTEGERRWIYMRRWVENHLAKT